jgi:hypothetical protein
MKYFTICPRVKYCNCGWDGYVLIRDKTHKRLFWNIWYQIDLGDKKMNKLEKLQQDVKDTQAAYDVAEAACTDAIEAAREASEVAKSTHKEACKVAEEAYNDAYKVVGEADYESALAASQTAYYAYDVAYAAADKAAYRVAENAWDVACDVAKAASVVAESTYDTFELAKKELEEYKKSLDKLLI